MSSDAAVRDAQIKSSEEECASGMGPMSSDAAVRDVRTKLKEEECAKGMGQMPMPSDAAVRDVPIMSSEEECAGGMGPRPLWNAKDAAVKGSKRRSVNEAWGNCCFETMQQ